MLAASTAGLNEVKRIKDNQSTSNILIIRKIKYVASTYKIVLLSSLLTIFARLRKEQ